MIYFFVGLPQRQRENSEEKELSVPLSFNRIASIRAS